MGLFSHTRNIDEFSRNFSLDNPLHPGQIEHIFTGSRYKIYIDINFLKTRSFANDDDDNDKGFLKNAYTIKMFINFVIQIMSLFLINKMHINHHNAALLFFINGSEC